MRYQQLLRRKSQHSLEERCFESRRFSNYSRYFSKDRKQSRFIFLVSNCRLMIFLRFELLSRVLTFDSSSQYETLSSQFFYTNSKQNFSFDSLFDYSSISSLKFSIVNVLVRSFEKLFNSISSQDSRLKYCDVKSNSSIENKFKNYIFSSMKKNVNENESKVASLNRSLYDTIS